MKILIICMFVLISGSICAQQPTNSTPGASPATKPEPVKLEPEEVRQTLNVLNNLIKFEGEYNKTLEATQATTLNCNDAIIAVGNQKLAGERLLNAKALYNGVLESWRKKYKCDRCEYAPDMKSLIPPRTEEMTSPNKEE